MMLSVRWWDERFYSDALQRDAATIFLRRARDRIRPGMAVLDIGAGAGERNVYDFKSIAEEMVGVDLDPRVEQNPLLHRGVLGDAAGLPFPDSYFDGAFSMYVLEHIADPRPFAEEVARVLKPGGWFMALTPNRRHYVAVAAALTPHFFHSWFNKKRGREEEDTFPTFYKLNTPRALRKAVRGTSLELKAVEMIEVRPNYLAFSLPTFLCGLAYERLVNSTDLFAGLRVNIACTLEKR